jgi:hypothetical protein
MNARVFVMVLSVLCVAAGWWKAIAWAGPTTSACELLTIQEVSKALNASVILDQSASGPDGRDGDNCVWNTSDGRNVMIRVAPLGDMTKAKVAYMVETMNAYGGGKPAEEIQGLVDDAKYRDYFGTLKGGVFIGRKRTTIVTVEGSPNREALLGLAKVLLSRL